MEKWKITLLVTVVIFILTVLGGAWTQRPIVDYYIESPSRTVNFELTNLTLILKVRNRGKTDTSLDLVLAVKNAIISREGIEPYMEYNETELRINFGAQSEMKDYAAHIVTLSLEDSPQNFSIAYSIVDKSGLSIAGLISRLFLEPHGYYATTLIYNRTDTYTYELLKF